MKASFRNSLLSACYNSVTERSWMLRNSPFRGLVYREVFLRSIFFHEGLLVLVWLLWQFHLIADARFANANCDFFVNFQKHCYVLAFFVGYQVRASSFKSASTLDTLTVANCLPQLAARQTDDILTRRLFQLYFSRTFQQISFSGYILAFFVGYQLEGQFFGSLKFRGFSI